MLPRQNRAENERRGGGAAASIPGHRVGGPEERAEAISSIVGPGGRTLASAPTLNGQGSLPSPAAGSITESVGIGRTTSLAAADAFDLLDFGDPTFASAGFIAPRHESYPGIALSPHPAVNPGFSSAWQTQRTPTSDNASKFLDDRSRKGRNFGANAARKETTPPQHRPLLDLNQNRRSSAPNAHDRTETTATTNHHLVLADYTLESGERPSNTSREPLTSRSSGRANYPSPAASDKNRVLLGSAGYRAGNSANSSVSGYGPSGSPGVSVTRGGDLPPSSQLNRDIEPHSGDDRYDLEFGDFSPSDEDFVTGGKAVQEKARQPDTTILGLIDSPPFSSRAGEMSDAHAGAGTGGHKWETVGSAEMAGPGAAGGAESSGMGTGGRGAEDRPITTRDMSSPARRSVSPSPSPSHQYLPVTPHTGVLGVSFMIPGSGARSSPHQSSQAGQALSLKETNLTSSPARLPSTQEMPGLTQLAPVRAQHQSPRFGDKYKLLESSTHGIETGSPHKESSSPSRALEGGPPRSPALDKSRFKADGRTSNGDLPQSRRQNNHRQQQMWQRNAYREFSPLPTASSSADEDEDDDRNHNDGIELEGLRGGRRIRGREPRRPSSRRHCHKPRKASFTDPLARRQLIAVVVLCLFFMVGEAVGGVLANSLALFTDVLHLGSDLVSFIISLLAMWLSSKPATRRMSFGYHRAEVLGALLSVFIIWLVSGILCYIAVERIVQEHYKDVKPDEMLITASLGVVINFIMGFVLHSEICCGRAHSHNKFGHGHSHGGHGHSHGGHGNSHGGHNDNFGDTSAAVNPGYDFADDKGLLDVRSQSVSSEDAFLPHTGNHWTPSGGGDAPEHEFEIHHTEESTEAHQLMNGTANESHDEENVSRHQQKNINVRAAFIHVVGDIIQSIGVLVAALIIKFTEDPKFRLADPVCTFLFSLLVLVTTAAVLRDTVLVIMEAVPRNLSLDVLTRDLMAVDGVVAVHSLHVWALTMDRNALSVHLAIDNSRLHDQVLASALAVTQDRHQFFSATIQVEMFDESMSQDCLECVEVK